MKKIELTQNKFALIDDEDFDRVSKIKWYVQKIRDLEYAYHDFRDKKGNGKMVSMHQFLLGGSNIDHKDNNGLNNQKNNLRVCTPHQNQCNRRKPKNAVTSIYKGVSINRGYIRASIQMNRKTIHLGYFNSEKEAAIAYNNKAKELFGEFAKLNPIT